METGSSSLLRRLGGAIGPPASSGSPVAPDRPTLDFGLMLDRARAGRLHSGLPVRVPEALASSLDDAARAMLSEAVDAASGEGISRALVLLGGRMFRVDVASRSVIDAPAAEQAAVADIDGFVRTSSEGPPGALGPGAGGHAGPARLVRNASLIRALAGAAPDRP